MKKFLLSFRRIVVALLYLSQVALAQQAGSNDDSFNTQDKVFKLSSGSASVTLVQPDGKILVGGSFVGGLIRYNADGSVDLNFQTKLGAGFLGSVN
ncbi:MAG: delta-60 repeat domain-containing protein, partial [Raineya sp.]|nr:delta-60 repeat domain-containing protein [Raineya sp.]